MSSGAGGEHVEDQTTVGPQELARRGECFEPLLVVVQMEIRAKRTDDERNALVHRRVPQVAEANLDERVEPGVASLFRADVEHAARRVDSDHGDAGGGDRNRDPTGADAELDDRTARRDRFLDVERDVLDDAPAPRVVQARDPVVRAGALRHADIVRTR